MTLQIGGMFCIFITGLKWPTRSTKLEKIHKFTQSPFFLATINLQWRSLQDSNARNKHTFFGTLFSAPLHGDGLKFPDTKFHRRGKLKTFEVQRPRFQKETKCKTFLMLMHVICMEIKICSDAVSSWTSFIAFWRGPKLRYKSVRENIFCMFS